MNHFFYSSLKCMLFLVVSPKETSHDFSSISRDCHCKVPLEAPRQRKGFKVTVSRYSYSGPDYITISTTMLRDPQWFVERGKISNSPSDKTGDSIQFEVCGITRKETRSPNKPSDITHRTSCFARKDICWL